MEWLGVVQFDSVDGGSNPSGLKKKMRKVIQCDR